VGFAQLVERLSETERYFDTDNLITNERSYLHVIDKLEDLGMGGGAYIGVGPGQNFSYIAQIKPSVAILVDIRRDNLLQHLLYKALFEMAGNRIEFLCLWLGRSLPEDLSAWRDRSLPEMVEYIDRRPSDPTTASITTRRIQDAVVDFGFPVTDQHLATVARFHQAFVRRGLDLRFTSHGRAPLPDYPTLRQLLLETDRDGDRRHYLTSEERFGFLKSLQERDLIVPVIGDLAGEHALVEIGRWLSESGETVSAFYTSNVEYYLVRESRFDRFLRNVAELPIDGRAVIIRSYFNRGMRGRHPQTVPGYSSTQLLQTIASLLDDYSGARRISYWDLVTRNSIDLH
jgi:hypothetical protein